MATWTQTLEPYIKVQERIKTAVLNPTAGESLIIGAVFISDAGPSTPTLITSQKEFLETYASQDLTKDYVESLNQLYTGDDKSLAATMWANAYRLAGSNTLLMVRASKASDIFFARPLQKGDQNVYILRDGALMKKVDSFKIVLDIDADDANHDQDGWNISIRDVGVFGNRTTDEGAQYDYLVRTLPDLVEQLNATSKFFSPAYKFYSDVKCENEVDETSPDIIAVKFDEVYLGVDIIDPDDPRVPSECDHSGEPIVHYGMNYLITAQPDWEKTDGSHKVIKLNDEAWSGFTPADYYATNVYNSATNLRVRVRRFNHDAVVSKEIAASSSLNENGESPYVVLKDVLNTYTKGGTVEPSDAILDRDFYEVAVLDPSISDTVSFFNLGKIAGRGDMELSELNSLLKMVQLSLPDNLHDLGLNYYGFDDDDMTWERDYSITEPDDERITKRGEPAQPIIVPAETDLWVPGKPVADKPAKNDVWFVTGVGGFRYVENGNNQVFANLTIDPTEYKILSVSDADLKKALDQIVLDEVYVTEGLCDLGNTELSFQSYMANVAINDNYFYPISTVNSTNYMTIGNAATKITQDSNKLYMSAPWDIDSATLGYKFYASPAVLYWETVARNRRNNREFAPVFGQANGLASYARPVVEFNKKQRQLLLSRKVNTVLFNQSSNAWNWNDNYTKQNENTIMNDEGNSRLGIRISKAMPLLLRQFIGKRISEKLCADVVSVIDYWFKTVILPMEYNIDDKMVFCEYDEALARQNKIKVVINVRYQRALKFVEIYNNALDLGMDVTNPEI